jgi:hypothetical protein
VLIGHLAKKFMDKLGVRTIGNTYSDDDPIHLAG